MSINRPPPLARHGSASYGGTSPLLLIIAGAGLATAAALAVPAWRHLHETPPAAPPAVRLEWPAPADLALGAGLDHPFGLSLAPNGRRAVFPATRGGITQLWLHDLTTGALRPLPETEGGVLPFWSPDGRQVGFFKAGRLVAQALENGQMADFGTPVAAPRGAVWHPSGDIILASMDGAGLRRRHAGAGTVEPLTTVDKAAGETAHTFPVLLEHGGHVVFLVSARDPMRQGIWIVPLDASGERIRLTASDAHAIAVDDWIIYARDASLFAQQVGSADDAPGPLSLTGRPRLLGTRVGHSSFNQLSATAAADVLMYGAPQPSLRRLEWIDRRGLTAGRLANEIEAWDVRIAPDGRRVAVTQIDSQLGTLDIFVYDDSRPRPRKISQAIDADESPVWSPDGTRIAWVTGRRTVTVRGAEAQLPDQPLRTFAVPVRIWDWSPDGHLIVGLTENATKEDLWVMAASGQGEPVAYAATPFNEREGVVSPDGRWIAYVSDESGRPEIYVDSFPAPGHRERITILGGSDPRWRRSGSAESQGRRPELFYRHDGRLNRASLVLGGTVPQVWDIAEQLVVRESRAYDAAPDGQRFLFNRPAGAVEPRPITVVVNWRSLLLGSPGTGGSR